MAGHGKGCFPAGDSDILSPSPFDIEIEDIALGLYHVGEHLPDRPGCQAPGFVASTSHDVTISDTFL